MKTMLIFGARGFLGGHFHREIIAGSEYEIVPSDIVPLSESKPVNYVRADITCYQEVFKLVDELQPDIVLNFAGIFNATEDVADYYKVNTLGSLNIMNSIRQIKKYNPRIILIGTAAEYGFVPEGELPVTEEHPLWPVSNYGISKAAQAYHVRQYASYGLDVMLARIFNMVGEGLSPLLSLSCFARQVAMIEAGKLRKLEVRNLNSKRDFIKVEQVIGALRFLISEGEKGQFYNICSGKSYRLRELLKILIGMSTAEIEIVKSESPGQRNAVNVVNIFGSNEKLRKMGFPLSVPEMKVQLSKMLDYWRENV